MNLQRVPAILLAMLASIVMIVEIGEFLILIWTWLTGSASTVTGKFDGAVILGTSMVTVVTMVVCLGMFASMWPHGSYSQRRKIAGLGVLTAAVQIAFVVVGLLGLGSDWLNEFYVAKQPSFLAGAVAALVFSAISFWIDVDRRE